MEDEKNLRNYIDVNGCIDMVCGDTKNALESEDYYMMRWIIKKSCSNLVLLLSIFTAFLTILTWYMNNDIIFIDAYVCRCRGCIIVSKRFFNWHRSIDIRIPVKSIRNTDGWSSSYSFFTRYQ